MNSAMKERKKRLMRAVHHECPDVAGQAHRGPEGQGALAHPRVAMLQARGPQEA